MKEESKVLRWKWEFMRRNPKYRSDYEKLQKRRQKIDYDSLIKQIKKDQFQWRKNHPTNSDDMSMIVADSDKCDEWLRTKMRR